MKNIITDYFIDDYIDSGNMLTDEQFKLLSPKDKRKYAMEMISIDKHISNKKFKLLSERTKRDYVITSAYTYCGKMIPDSTIKLLSKKSIRDYAFAIAKNGNPISNLLLSYLSEIELFYCIVIYISNGSLIEDYSYYIELLKCEKLKEECQRIEKIKNLIFINDDWDRLMKFADIIKKQYKLNV